MRKSVIIMLILLITSLITCADKPSSPPPVPTGVFRLYLQDGLADFDAVNIAVDSVSISRPGDSSDEIYLLSEPRTFDLTTLRNGNKALIGDTVLTEGYIYSITIVFSPINIIIDTDTCELSMTPGVDNTVQIFVMAQIIEEDATEYLVDIDLMSSITERYGGTSFYFEPDVTVSDIKETGGIYGTVTPQADVFLLNMQDSSIITYTKSIPVSNYFGLFGLEPGFYNVLCAPRGIDSLYYEPLLNENVPVLPDDEFDMGTLVLLQPLPPVISR